MPAVAQPAETGSASRKFAPLLGVGAELPKGKQERMAYYEAALKQPKNRSALALELAYLRGRVDQMDDGYREQVEQAASAVVKAHAFVPTPEGKALVALVKLVALSSHVAGSAAAGNWGDREQRGSDSESVFRSAVRAVHHATARPGQSRPLFLDWAVANGHHEAGRPFTVGMGIMWPAWEAAFARSGGGALGEAGLALLQSGYLSSSVSSGVHVHKVTLQYASEAEAAAAQAVLSELLAKPSDKPGVQAARQSKGQA